MSNLIITIISIALAAFVAIAGIWYGGDIYTGYLVNAKANEIISVLRQIQYAAAALKLDSGGSLSALTDPYGDITDCAANTTTGYDTYRECLVRVLTNNSKYLAAGLDMKNYTGVGGYAYRGQFGEFDPSITLGPYGQLKGDVVDGMNVAKFYIHWEGANYPPGVNDKVHVQLRMAPTNYTTLYAGTTNGISQAQFTYFLVKICHRINQIMGVELSDGTYPVSPPTNAIGMNNNNITGSTFPIKLPYNAAVSPWPQNYCYIGESGATISNFFINFPIP